MLHLVIERAVLQSTCTGNSGAITIGAGATVGGNVETATAGAITVGALATVTGGVTVRQAGALTIGAGAIVKNEVDNDTCLLDAPTTLEPSIESSSKTQGWMTY